MATMAEIKPEPEKEVKSIVLIAMDGSEHSNAAFKCKYIL